MNLNARWNCLRLCVAAVLAVPTALLPAEPLVNLVPPLPAPGGDKTNDPNRFWVSGVVYMTGTPVALLTDTARSRSWFIWGNRQVDRYRLGEVTREYVIFIDPRDGKELKIFVDTRTESTDPKSSGPALFTKEWINSQANPMFGHLVSPPQELYEDWPNATDADKAEIAGFYEKYGWKLARAEIVAGAADFVWEWLYETDRIAGAQASREAFVGLLSPEQRQTWDQIQAKQTIYAVNGKYTPEQEGESAERRRVFLQFKSTFTAEQTAAFDNMSRRVYSASKRPDRKEAEFTLPRLAATGPATPGGPAPYTKAWINSKANPLLHNYDLRINRHIEQNENQSRPDPGSYSGNIFRHWAALNSAERVQVVEFYKKHGWQLLHIETVSGISGSQSWRNIYEQERAAVLKAQYDAFSASLSAEQRRVWRSGALNQTVYIADEKPDYARYHNRPEQQVIFDHFWSTLDAPQRAAYADLHDFTKADWQ